MKFTEWLTEQERLGRKFKLDKHEDMDLFIEEWLSSLCTCCEHGCFVCERFNRT